MRERDVKKQYEKPMLVRRDLLPRISGQNGSVGSPIAIIIEDE
jgi:hypothetical protein